MLKVVAIGRRADILPFRAVGAHLMEVDGAAGPTGAAAALDGLRGETGAVMVMMTEEFVDRCRPQIEAFRAGGARAFLAVPSPATPAGKRLGEMRALVARALGVDLLGRAKRVSETGMAGAGTHVPPEGVIGAVAGLGGMGGVGSADAP